MRVAYLPQPEQEQAPEEQVQELEEPEQPQSPFILMVVFGCGVLKTKTVERGSKDELLRVSR